MAVAGVAFAVVLIFMQLGFQEALFKSAVRYHTALGYDLAIISPKTDYLNQPQSFARSRLFQVRGFPGVSAVTPVYIGQKTWRDPTDPLSTRLIFVVGFDPTDLGLDLPGVAGQVDKLKLRDRVLFDQLSRPEYGPIRELFESQGRVRTEVGIHRVEVVGLFRLGTSFGIDGSLLTSDLNFQRLFPDRNLGRVDLGLIQLARGVDPAQARAAIAADIPGDVLVLTRDAFVAREVDYWSNATPIGYVFGFGVIMGLVVGAIIVYQILFSDVQDHLQEYATLKAMGYTNRYLFGVVLQEAAILAVLGFVPGLLACLVIYSAAGQATRLPIEMTVDRGVLVLGLTLGMCALSGAIALRKIRSADPADVF